ncbi:MAG TPA: DNA polymerase ligase N-terminal domain-containing protein [Candidatus Babeliales bacterium]|nr:DNA polymerase ligase N-terminal domain-containing protein [Candidatus Babeliales bacterium]
MTRKDPLKKYRQRRNPKETPEPFSPIAENERPIFVIQKHNASHLHYDFRLAIGGVLVSWAVPKGLPHTTTIKRLAVQTEDHPMEYATFAGTIPAGQYGAGTVEIWDHGTYTNIAHKPNGQPISMEQSIKNGRVEVELHGNKVKGSYALILMRNVSNSNKKNWLMLKMKAEVKHEVQHLLNSD